MVETLSVFFRFINTRFPSKRSKAKTCHGCDGNFVLCNAFRFIGLSTVSVKLTFTFLSYLSYQVFLLSYRENCLSGFAFIVYMYQVLHSFNMYQALFLAGLSRFCFYRVNRNTSAFSWPKKKKQHRKTQRSLHFVIIVWLSNIADSYLP